MMDMAHIDHLTMIHTDIHIHEDLIDPDLKNQVEEVHIITDQDLDLMKDMKENIQMMSENIDKNQMRKHI